MGRPQQPELNRSGKTPLEPDSIESELEARKQQRPGQGDESGGPVPEDNRPGHHPDRDQDKPDPDAFVERFGGGDRSADTADAAGTADAASPDAAGTEATDGPEAASSPASASPSASLPVDDLLRELVQRVRQRDLVLIATYPIHAAVELLRYGRDRVLALR